MRKVMVGGVALLAVAGALAGSVSFPPITQAAVVAISSGPHLLVVPDSDKARAALRASKARTVASYDSFTLVEAAGQDVTRLLAVGADLRDDMREVRIGTKSSDPKTARASLLDASRGGSLRVAGSDGYGLAVVQYVGPLKDAWIDAVRATGVEVVQYMAQNGQLVSGDAKSLYALGRLRQSFIRAVTPYGAADKLLPGLNRGGATEVVVSTVAGKAGDAARAAIAGAATPKGDALKVAGIVQQRLSLSGAALDGIAALGGVVAIEPWVEPKLLDERAAKIVANTLDGSFQPVLGTGYRQFLADHHLSSLPLVIVDITDEGVDKGVVPVPAGAHADFYAAGNPANPSRILYAHEATAADSDARDCGGHGTNVASISTGYNAGTGASVEDAQGFNYGLGINPFARIGATKIFNCGGNYDVTTSVAALHDLAYAAGARVSNNSWGSDVLGAYTTRSQEFDALVRDARPGVAGNQGFTEVVSAGNSGAGPNTIGSPGTAKNVITVGASENVRPIGATDGCGVTDAGADSARDIIDFSSRGPTDDGRIKPDVIAPGTHVSGAQPQTGADFNGSGTCNPQFPAASTLYTLVSGTSQAAPEVTGFASLIRGWYHEGLGGGTAYPNPAMIKALMINAATDVVGGNDGAGGANANVPTQIQGWGRINLNRLVSGANRQVIDQTQVLHDSGVAFARYYNVASSSQRLLVTLVWTDAVGPTTGNSFVNDLNLEVTAGGITYKGNVFSGGLSVAGGAADPRNNVENVFLPLGITGSVKVRVVAANIAGDGIPGNADTTDQDFALVVTNVSAPVSSAAVLTVGATTVTAGGDADGVLEPGEPFSISQGLKNIGNATAMGVNGVLTSTEATITQANSAWPNISAGVTKSNSTLFQGTAKSTLACGSDLDLSLAVTYNAGSLNIPLAIPLGAPGTVAVTRDSTDVPKAIPDDNGSGVASTITVTTLGTISDMDVKIGQITHTFDSDLQIELTSPQGTKVLLFNRRGGSGDNLTNTVFDDSAATAIGAGTAPFTGSFIPDQPLSAFNGERLNGAWILTVRDLAAEDLGTLSAWSTIRKLYKCN